MDLLFAIQDDVLKQKEQEAVNYFSHVQELREFIMTARPARDVVATLKRNIDFRPGAVYVLHQVDYLGFHDGIANGTIHYEVNNAYKIREVSPPLSKLK
ncbi:hypothetical protein PR001_g33311 [Phytophthora rubi]|uniref:Uncharacterized protein n=1 Tax=Phytophthora rubi TaxID=129364 RepID=A0A6A3G455_9STRA|nr:hypothetical protein PR001_g33311 [Phytophthora rubi]